MRRSCRLSLKQEHRLLKQAAADSADAAAAAAEEAAATVIPSTVSKAIAGLATPSLPSPSMFPEDWRMVQELFDDGQSNDTQQQQLCPIKLFPEVDDACETARTQSVDPLLSITDPDVGSDAQEELQSLSAAQPTSSGLAVTSQVPMSFSQLLSEADTETQQPMSASCSQAAPVTAPAGQHQSPHAIPASQDTSVSTAQGAFASQDSAIQTGQGKHPSPGTGLQMGCDASAHHNMVAQAADVVAGRQGTGMQCRDTAVGRQGTEQQQIDYNAAATQEVHTTAGGALPEMSSSLDQVEWDLHGLDDLMWEELEDLGLDASSNQDMPSLGGLDMSRLPADLASSAFLPSALPHQAPSLAPHPAPAAVFVPLSRTSPTVPAVTALMQLPHHASLASQQSSDSATTAVSSWHLAQRHSLMPHQAAVAALPVQQHSMAASRLSMPMAAATAQQQPPPPMKKSNRGRKPKSASTTVPADTSAPAIASSVGVATTSAGIEAHAAVHAVGSHGGGPAVATTAAPQVRKKRGPYKKRVKKDGEEKPAPVRRRKTNTMMPAVEAFAKQIQSGQNTAQQQHGSADSQQPALKRARLDMSLPSSWGAGTAISHDPRIQPAYHPSSSATAQPYCYPPGASYQAVPHGVHPPVRASQPSQPAARLVGAPRQFLQAAMQGRLLGQGSLVSEVAFQPKSARSASRQPQPHPHPLPTPPLSASNPATHPISSSAQHHAHLNAVTAPEEAHSSAAVRRTAPLAVEAAKQSATMGMQSQAPNESEANRLLPVASTAPAAHGRASSAVPYPVPVPDQPGQRAAAPGGLPTGQQHLAAPSGPYPSAPGVAEAAPEPVYSAGPQPFEAAAPAWPAVTSQHTTADPHAVAASCSAKQTTLMGTDQAVSPAQAASSYAEAYSTARLQPQLPCDVEAMAETATEQQAYAYESQAAAAACIPPGTTMGRAPANEGFLSPESANPVSPAFQPHSSHITRARPDHSPGTVAACLSMQGSGLQPNQAMLPAQSVGVHSIHTLHSSISSSSSSLAADLKLAPHIAARFGSGRSLSRSTAQASQASQALCTGRHVVTSGHQATGLPTTDSASAAHLPQQALVAAECQPSVVIQRSTAACMLDSVRLQRLRSFDAAARAAGFELSSDESEDSDGSDSSGSIFSGSDDGSADTSTLAGGLHASGDLDGVANSNKSEEGAAAEPVGMRTRNGGSCSYRAPPAEAQKKKGTKHITMDFLEQGGYFDAPIQAAAQQLQVGVTTLKKICRTAKVTRWPFRKRTSIERLIERTQYFMADDDDLQQKLAELQPLLAERDCLKACQGKDVDGPIKKFRQSMFKRVHKEERERKKAAKAARAEQNAAATRLSRKRKLPAAVEAAAADDLGS